MTFAHLISTVVILLALCALGCSPKQEAATADRASGTPLTVVDRLFEKARLGDEEGVRELLATETILELERLFRDFERQGARLDWGVFMEALGRFPPPVCRPAPDTAGGNKRLVCTGLAGEVVLKLAGDGRNLRVTLPVDALLTSTKN